MLELVATMPSRPFPRLLLTLDIISRLARLTTVAAPRGEERGECNFLLYAKPGSYSIRPGSDFSDCILPRSLLAAYSKRLVHNSPRNPWWLLTIPPEDFHEALFIGLPCLVLSSFHRSVGRRGHVALQRGPEGQNQGQVWLPPDAGMARSRKAFVSSL